MSCSHDFSSTDPASLIDGLVLRAPAIESRAAKFLRDAALQFFMESYAWRDQRRTISVNPIQQEYDTPILSVGKVFQVMNVWVPPTEHCSEEWRMPELREAKYNEHAHWHSPTPETIQFHTPITTVDNVRLDLALRPTVEDPTVHADLLIKYREGIYAYALKTATMASDTNTLNLRTTDFYEQVYQNEVMKAKRYYKNTLSAERPTYTRRQSDSRRRQRPTQA